MHGAFGGITASLELLPDFPIKDVKFSKVDKFQDFVFSEILRLENRLLESKREVPFFILPLHLRKFLTATNGIVDG